MSNKPYDPYPRRVIEGPRPGRPGISPYSVNPSAKTTSDSQSYGEQQATAERARIDAQLADWQKNPRR